MKNLLIIFLVSMFILSCTSQQPITRVPDENLIISPQEKDEYELIILDPGFDAWFITNSKPIGFYSKSYYETKNKLYVSSWNELYYRYGSNSPFENRIYYDLTTDYGIELNYQLFWYFKYIENKYGRFYNFPA